MVAQDTFQQLVLAIYDTVADPSKWPGVLDQIVDQSNACGSLIFEIEEDQLRVATMSGYFQPEPLTEYLRLFKAEETADQTEFLKQSLSGDGHDILSDSILFEDVEEFKSRPHVQYVMQAGILHRAAVLLSKDNSNLARFSIQFGSERGPITEEESAYLNKLLPHVSKALELGRPATQLGSVRRSMLSALDHLTIGVCVLDAKGRVVERNEEFRRQEEAYRAFDVARSGRLQFVDAGNARMFDDLLSDSRKHGQFGARPRKEALSADVESVLCIEVVPLKTADALGGSTLDGHLVYSTDTSCPTAFDARLFGSLYGLTETEVELASLIAEGLTNAQIAERRGRSVETVSSHVKSILSKTQCATRTQFVRMLMTFGGRFVSPASSLADS